MERKIVPVDGDLAETLNRTYTGIHRSGWVLVDGCCLPQYYEKFADAIENFEVRDDDVWVCSFPKTGTTWTQEMVWSICNDMESEAAKVRVSLKFPHFDCSYLWEPAAYLDCGFEIPEVLKDSVSYTAKLPSPRFIKTHLPFHLLPRQIRTGERRPKILYVTRDPKDTCISFFHYCSLLEGYKGNFEEFCDLFLGDRLNYAPFWPHVLGYWEKKDLDNMLWLTYDDMQKDLPSVLRNTAKFLGKNLNTDEVKTLEKHLSFENMKQNPAVNYEVVVKLAQALTRVKNEGKFIRRGTTGQWKTDMSRELIQRFDDWTRKNLEGTTYSL